MPSEPFANSLGVHTGKPERVEIFFDARTAPFALEREWHPSQKFEPKKDGAVLMTMDVCNDYGLHRCVLGWGSGATVVAPASLAEAITGEFENAATVYQLRLGGIGARELHSETLMIREPQRKGKWAS